MPGYLSSPRSNLNRLLANSCRQPLDDDAIERSAEILGAADAENKLHHRKLYLVLDLDETLVFSQRLEPGAAPVGTQITVHGQPFDVVLRPGLKFFLNSAQKNFIIFMYTMGDAEYTRAVLDVIDPDHSIFTGGVCVWRPDGSRVHKSLRRTVCDRSMALIVDDSVDVWRDDLRNLCLCRRFVGDPSDDGLQCLSWQLQLIHSSFYAAVRDLHESFSLEDAECPRPPDVRDVLATHRGKLLANCKICLTGVLPEQTDGELARQPLCMLVRLYGGTVSLSMDTCTHLVARKKDGWLRSSKIQRAIQMSETDAAIIAVWDHWLWDSIATWTRQSEGLPDYAVPLNGVGQGTVTGLSYVASAAERIHRYGIDTDKSIPSQEEVGGRHGNILGGGKPAANEVANFLTRKRGRDSVLESSLNPANSSIGVPSDPRPLSISNYLQKHGQVLEKNIAHPGAVQAW